MFFGLAHHNHSHSFHVFHFITFHSLWLFGSHCTGLVFFYMSACSFHTSYVIPFKQFSKSWNIKQSKTAHGGVVSTALLHVVSLLKLFNILCASECIFCVQLFFFFGYYSYISLVPLVRCANIRIHILLSHPFG